MTGIGRTLAMPLDAPSRCEPGQAMISRIRVEGRGETMDAVRFVLHALLDHARMAGYLDGITPQRRAGLGVMAGVEPARHVPRY